VKASRVLLTLVAGTLVGGLLVYGYSRIADFRIGSRDQGDVQASFPEEVLVMRTRGGLLEVATVATRESVDTKFVYTLLGIPVGETVPRIRVPAIYRYHIELAPEWKILRRENAFIVVAPPLKPSLPVAVDFRRMEKDIAGSWILASFTEDEDLDDLQRSLGTRLARNAASPNYVKLVREDARATVLEFVKKWLVTQAPWQSVSNPTVRVVFADEPASSLAPELVPGQ
jgi:hypothetical protein